MLEGLSIPGYFSLYKIKKGERNLTFDSSIYKGSKNAMGADNQQERIKRKAGDYIAGFVDGEGSFSITIQRTKNVRLGIQVIPEFHACQHRNRNEVLEFIKSHYLRK